MTRRDLPDRYEAGALLGEGGSGRVYRVKDRLRDRVLALKLVTPKESAFLRREFDTLRQVRHENLIRVFDWGWLTSGEAYYTMELIEGEDWGYRMGVPQVESEVRRILTGLLRGIAHLHCHGEVHGDLKPGNILLGTGGLVKVADAGMGGGGGRAGISGTPGYAAPEVWEGRSADARSDLYSVGVMAYEALTGKHPFGAKTIREVVAGQMQGWVPSPAAHGARVGADLERVVMRALERNPAHRQPTADELMEGIGLEDRVGEILGGRFVDRDQELSLLGQQVGGPGSDSSLVCLLIGPQGSGRAALMEEFRSKVLHDNGVVIGIEAAQASTAEALLRAVASQIPRAPARKWAARMPASPLDALAEYLVEQSAVSQVAVLFDGRATADQASVRTVRGLARYTLVKRSGTPPVGGKGIVFVLAFDEAPSEREPFETQVSLEPFSVRTLQEQVSGILGNARLSHAVASQLHSITGGIPGTTAALVADLIERKILYRGEGEWRLRPSESLAEASYGAIGDPLARDWVRLAETERALLTALALISECAGEGLAPICEAAQIPPALARLQSRGWLRSRDGLWSISSGVARRIVLRHATPDSQAAAAKALLSGSSRGLDEGERADLLLLASDGQEAVDPGIAAASAAAASGDHALAIRRLTSVLARCEQLGLRVKWIEGALALAASLNAIGEDARAIALLGESTQWQEPSVPAEARAIRAHRLGILHRTGSRLEEARKWFQECIALAKSEHLLALWTIAHADLGQIDWEFGTQEERAAAIERMRAALAEVGPLSGLDDERAALTYGLGAALIWAGDRGGGKRVLLEGANLKCSDYWQMRIANGLNAAEKYLSDYASALRWAGRAWDLADRLGADAFKPRILANRGATLYAMGRLKESAEQDMLSAEWGLKIGNPFEYEAGLSGAAVNYLALADYERALRCAREARIAGQRAKNEIHLAKAIELEALAHYHLGDPKQAKELIRDAVELLRNHEYVETAPRLDWLLAVILVDEGNMAEGKNLLERAERALLQIRDLEDLLGIQVELGLLRYREDRSRDHLATLSRIARDAKSAKVLLPFVSAAAAIGEILAEAGGDDGSSRDTLIEALTTSSSSGVLEMSWRLSYYLGCLANRAESRRERQAYFSQSVRIIREISQRLEPSHRGSYLASRRVRSALDAMAVNQ